MTRLRPVLAPGLFVIVLVLAGPALAASAVGTWVFDQAAMHAQAIRLADVMVKRLPADPQKSIAAQAEALTDQAASLSAKAGNDPKARATIRRLEQRAAEMRAVAADPRGYFRTQFNRVASNPTASLKLQKGGTALTTMQLGGERKTESGSWSAKGRTVTVAFAGQDDTVRAAGPLAGNRLELKVVPPGGADRADEIVRDYTLYLVRK